MPEKRDLAGTAIGARLDFSEFCNFSRLMSAQKTSSRYTK
jgi:hypothetical protein